jgi:hypothetical protein
LELLDRLLTLAEGVCGLGDRQIGDHPQEQDVALIG